MIRTIVIADPAVRANLRSALAGSRAPAGITASFERDDLVTVRFDDAATAPEAVDTLITLASHFVAVPGASTGEEAARLTAVGLDAAALDPSCRERQLAGLE